MRTLKTTRFALSLALLAAASAAGAQQPNDIPLTPTQQMPADIPAPASAETVNKRFGKLDRNGDGRIASSEADADMKAHWDKWDFDKDSALSLTEFTSGLSLNKDKAR